MFNVYERDPGTGFDLAAARTGEKEGITAVWPLSPIRERMHGCCGVRVKRGLFLPLAEG